MKQNLGRLDRIFRFVAGIWILQWVLPMVSQPVAWWVLLVVGLISLAESFTAHCWIHEFVGIHNEKQ